MKISPRHLFLCAAAAISLGLTSAFAQPTADKSADTAATSPVVIAPAAAEPSAVAEPAADQPVTPVATSEPAAATADQTPADAAPAEQPAASAVVAPEPAPATGEPTVESSEPPALRRLDTETPAPADSKAQRKAQRHRNRHSTGREIVNVWGNSFLAKGEKADTVVAVLGSATSEGEVSDAVVSVLGNTRVTGPVGDAAVAVLGNVYVDSKVGNSVVAVLGNIELGPNAEVNDVVAVGGTVKRDPKAIVHGQINNVGTGKFSNLEWLHSWVVNCAFYFRPLAFAPHLMWAWWIALGFLAFYVVLALIAPKAVNKCAETLEQRPGFSILTALLTVLLAPFVFVLLALTGVGIAVIPFLGAALFFAGLFGKAVMFAWIGRRVTKFLGSDHPALAVLIGGVMVLLLYTVPVLGLVLYKLLGWIGLGVVVYTLVLGMKRERPVPMVPPVPPTVPPAPGGAPIDPATGAAPLAAGLVVTAGLTPPVMAAVTLPRAGFWIRLAAMLLDVIIVGMICGFLASVFSDSSHIRIKANLLPSLALYGALMWKLRGSTVGGIVCGLKVVRLDDRPLDWGTAIVRALSCFLSLFVAGLGFIWVAFDNQRQGWHDKIAGTTVVRVPKGVSLV